MAKPAYSGRWKQVRLAVLERDGWRCQLRLPGCTLTADAVDHLVSPEVRPVLRLDPANLRAACTHCNSSRGGQDGNARRHRKRRSKPSRDW